MLKVNLLARYIGDYLSSAELASNPNAYYEKYWPDYYEDGYSEDENETILLSNVPEDIADNLLKQGTSDQYYSDGYEAANIAAKYIH